MIGADSKTTKAAVVPYFPHLAALHPDTIFTAFREHKGEKQLVEFTIFYTEPGQEKMRIDAELKDQDYAAPTNIRITYWGKAIGANR